MKIIISIIAFTAISYNTMFSQIWDFTEPVKISTNVNSNAEESMPVFAKDSMILYFVRTYENQNLAGENDQDIWFSKRDKSGNYSKAEKMDDLNNKNHNAVFGANKSGNILYLLSSYDGKKDYVKGCAVSNFSNGKWSKPERIQIPGLDIEGNFYSFNMNQKEDVLIISYIGVNSAGEEDLYFSMKNKEGKWSEPKSLGSNINTKGFEISPFLSTTGDTLFFSSNGHGGLGDADIFYAVKKGNAWDSWSKPINLGSKINSPKFDAYLSYSERQVFWSSNRDDKYSDIYTSLPFVKTPLLADASGKDVTIHKGSDGKIDLNVSGGKGPYTYLWSNGAIVEDPTNLVKGDYTVKVTDQWNQVAEVKVHIDEPLPIKENLEEIIYFDLDKYAFNDENVQTLDAFLTKLNGKTNYKIIVESHCDQRASIPYNVRLSKNRLNTVSKYLVKNGIDKKIISGTFKGKSEPMINCEDCTEEEYRKNRRTTLKVIML
ncbi:MAG: OmpA family protein [Flavobacteriia bacterium]|jgi:outer membrane protein OmpA-like peptidoglycan-associated protein